jgi:hypothetical protein
MSFLLFAAYRLCRADLDAQAATGAFSRIDAVGDECLADTRRTAVISDVRIILFPEIFDRAQYRVGGAAA